MPHVIEALKESHQLYIDNDDKALFASIIKTYNPTSAIAAFNSEDCWFIHSGQWAVSAHPIGSRAIINLSDVEGVSTDFVNGEEVEVSDNNKSWTEMRFYIGKNKDGLHVTESPSGILAEWKFCRRPQTESVELEIGKWYWIDRSAKTQFSDDNKNALVFNNWKDEWYGFDHGGNWNDIYGTPINDGYRIVEASEKEITDALSKEAIRRGLIKGCYWMNPSLPSFKEHAETDRYSLSDDFKRLYLDGNTIMHNGIWATPLPQITRAEVLEKYGAFVVD